jgi:uncharacterized membrane protein
MDQRYRDSSDDRGQPVSVVEVSAEVEAPPDRVWKVVADPRNLPTWDRHITSVEDVPKGGLRQGSEYRTAVRFLGARSSVTSRVAELRPNEYARVEVRGLVDATVETWVEPLDGGRTLLKHRVRYRFKGGALGELAARAVQMLGATAMLRRGVQAQKRQAESG